MADNGNGEEQGVHRPACAACKLQRRKCQRTCPLWKHFPADKNKEFLAVHKVFGVKNMSSMLKHAKDDVEVAKSLAWEAETWVQEPVHGPYGLYKRLEERCRVLEQEVEELREYKRKHMEQLHMAEMRAQAGLYPPKIDGIFDGSSMMEMGNGSFSSLLHAAQGRGVMFSSFPAMGRMGNSLPYGAVGNRFEPGYGHWASGGSGEVVGSGSLAVHGPSQPKGRRAVDREVSGNDGNDEGMDEANYVDSNYHVKPGN